MWARVNTANAGSASRVLWARRIGGYNAWQFPQGGIHVGESPEDAAYRELHEEIGVAADAVTILGQTSDWLHYRRLSACAAKTRRRAVSAKSRNGFCCS